MTSVIDEILDLYARRGQASYGEGVTQNEHALQAAMEAEQAGAGSTLVTAALLHDIGHLLHDLPEDIADQGIDTQHESLGSAWLSRHFGRDVSEPVRLHVPAKRYLCATEIDYAEALSEASKLSLRLQGGPMSATEVESFAANSYAEDAVRLRRWDDLAKVAGRRTPGFDHFRSHIERALIGC